jgi:cytoskeleton protein RodZ
MQEETVGITKKGPGEKLKRARESFGFSVWDAASQLYLPERVIKALEEDDYHAGLPVRAFVRGYLQSYSKLLQLPPEEILAEFDALGIYKTPQEESTKALAQPRAVTMVHKDKFWFGVVGGSLLAILLLIVMLTWFNTHKEKKEDLLNQSLQQEDISLKTSPITEVESQAQAQAQNQTLNEEKTTASVVLATPMLASVSASSTQITTALPPLAPQAELLVPQVATVADLAKVTENTASAEPATPLVQVVLN